jgi:hypothetical protein
MENKCNSSLHRSHCPEGKRNASSTKLAKVQDVVADGTLCQMCLNYDPLTRLSLLKSISEFLTLRSGGSCAYGNIGDIRSRKACLFCNLISRVVSLDLLSTTQIYLRPPPREIANAYLDIYAERQFQGRVEPFNGPIDGYKQTVLPNTDPALIRGLLHCCERDHDHSRLSDCRIYKTPIDITLVDISESRLLRASSRDRYLALSYVWGEVSMFQTTMSNRSSLEEPGSLIKVMEEIPQVIQDSMALVSALGERYLWVDCLV